MKKTILLFTLALCLFSTSCKKEPLSGSTLIYEGTWDSDSGEAEITINADGSASYYSFNGIVTKNINGRAVISDTQLKIKAGFVSKKFSINRQPSTDSNGFTTMVLSGEVYEREY